METKNFVERRKHRRYIVRGRVKFSIDSLQLWGDLVNFGHGGMQIRTRYEIPETTQLDFRVIAYCYPDMFAVLGQVVGTSASLLAVKFLQSTAGAKELLQWLEAEHYPWTGGIGLEDAVSLEARQRSSWPATPASAVAIFDPTEYVFQDA